MTKYRGELDKGGISALSALISYLTHKIIIKNLSLVPKICYNIIIINYVGQGGTELVSIQRFYNAPPVVI